MNCNEIKREADELKMTFKSCSKLSTSQMIRLTDLILSLDDCKCSCKDAQVSPEISSFQFDSVTLDINDINLLTDEFVSINGLYHNEDSILNGKNIQFDKLGRIGFIAYNTFENPFIINDLFGNDITSITFDYIYDSELMISYYVSKEFITPSILYFKFIKD